MKLFIVLFTMILSMSLNSLAQQTSSDNRTLQAISPAETCNNCPRDYPDGMATDSADIVSCSSDLPALDETSNAEFRTRHCAQNNTSKKGHGGKGSR